MSKEPEDLDISMLLKFIDDWLNRYDVCNIDYNFYKIKQALQRLKAIDNADPSEALKALKELRVIANTYCSFNDTQCEHNKELADIIEKALIKIQSNEYKIAFDLINKKRVDIKLLHWAYPSCKAYNVAVREKKETWRREELTEEEFEFIGRLAGAR